MPNPVRSKNRNDSQIKQEKLRAIASAKEIKDAKEAAKIQFKDIFQNSRIFAEARKGNKKAIKILSNELRKLQNEHLEEILNDRKINRSDVRNKISQVNPKWNSIRQKIEKSNTGIQPFKEKQTNSIKPVIHEVPVIIQENTMSCWHASVRMIWASKKYQSIDPLPSIYSSNSGLNPDNFIDLANQYGLKSVPEVNESYSGQKISTLLSEHGSLWVAGRWDGVEHIIVVTGITSEGNIIINDPAIGSRIENVKWFNERIASDVDNPIMFLP